MDMRDAMDRYHRDAAFAALVDSLRHAIRTLQLAPSEVREAAMFAVYAEEMSNPRPIRWTGGGT